MSVSTFTLNGQTYSINGYNVDFEPSTNISPGATYTVQTGDNLSLIGQKCGVSSEAIAAANNLTSPYTIHVGEVLLIPNTNPIHELFDQFMSSFAQALHGKDMSLSVDVAPWNMISSEAPNNGGVFWDYAGLASSVNYVVDMDYVSTFCYTSFGNTSQVYTKSCTPYSELNPNGYDGTTFYDQYLMTREFVPASKIMIALESIGCGQDEGGGSNCIAGQEITFLSHNSVLAIGIWPSPNFLTTSGLSASPYPGSYDWYQLSEAFILDLDN
jgi:LysM repeat protein